MSALERARMVAWYPLWLVCASGWAAMVGAHYAIDVLARLTRR